MYRSTTPTIRLHVKNEDFDMSLITECHLTIENDSGRNKKIFEDPEVDIENKIISQTLTQDESKSFEVGTILLQLKVKLNDESVVASRIVRTTLHEILELENL